MSSASKIEWTEEDRALLERLRRAQRYIHQTNGGGEMTVEQKLADEALWYAERGDFDEARHRLRLRDHPKWHDPGKCAAAYEQAMAEKRGAAA